MMPLETWFWVIYVLAILFSMAGVWQSPPPDRWRWGGWLILWVLVGILGLKAFGGPVK
jgi:hypothetical protein